MKPLPSLEDRHPPLQALLQDRVGIQARIKEKTAEQIAVSTRIRDNPNPGNAEANRLNKLLNKPTEPDVAPDRERLPELVSDIAALNLALQKNDNAIQKGKGIASRLICEDVSGEHTKLVRDFANKLIELHGSHERYVKFLDHVERTGASLTSLRVVGPYTLGHPASVNGTYYWSLREFIDNGHIQQGELPKAFR